MEHERFGLDDYVDAEDDYTDSDEHEIEEEDAWPFILGGAAKGAICLFTGVGCFWSFF